MQNLKAVHIYAVKKLQSKVLKLKHSLFYHNFPLLHKILQFYNIKLCTAASVLG